MYHECSLPAGARNQVRSWGDTGGGLASISPSSATACPPMSASPLSPLTNLLTPSKASSVSRSRTLDRSCHSLQPGVDGFVAVSTSAEIQKLKSTVCSFALIPLHNPAAAMGRSRPDSSWGHGSSASFMVLTHAMTTPSSGHNALNISASAWSRMWNRTRLHPPPVALSSLAMEHANCDFSARDSFHALRMVSRASSIITGSKDLT